jgi:hypothetical protein
LQIARSGCSPPRVFGTRIRFIAFHDRVPLLADDCDLGVMAQARRWGSMLRLPQAVSNHPASYRGADTRPQGVK